MLTDAHHIFSKLKRLGPFKTLSRLARDQYGVSAIEFAIIAPIMISLYIFLYEISLVYKANGAVNNASEIAASFPTFETTLTQTQLSDIMTATGAVVDFPLMDPSRLTIRIYSLQQDTSNIRQLVGRATYEGANAASLPVLDTNDFNSIGQNLEPGQGIIMAQIAYNYKLLFSSEFVETFTLDDVKSFNPRQNTGQSLPFDQVDSDGNVIASGQRAHLGCIAATSSGISTFTCDTVLETYNAPS